MPRSAFADEDIVYSPNKYRETEGILRTNLADNVIAVEKPNLNVTKNRDFGELTYIECAYSPINRRIFQVNTGDTFRYSWNHMGIGKPETPAVENPSFAIKTGENRAAVNF